MWRSYYKWSHKKFCKKQVGKMWPKSSKTLMKDKTPVKLQAWHFISKTKSSHWNLFFHKVTGQKPATLLKKILRHRCFPVNFAKFLRTPFSENTFGRLLLQNLFVRLIRISGCFLIQILFLWCLSCVYV